MAPNDPSTPADPEDGPRAASALGQEPAAQGGEPEDVTRHLFINVRVSPDERDELVAAAAKAANIIPGAKAANIIPGAKAAEKPSRVKVGPFVRGAALLRARKMLVPGASDLVSPEDRASVHQLAERLRQNGILLNQIAAAANSDVLRGEISGRINLEQLATLIQTYGEIEVELRQIVKRFDEYLKPARRKG